MGKVSYTHAQKHWMLKFPNPECMRGALEDLACLTWVKMVSEDGVIQAVVAVEGKKRDRESPNMYLD